MPGLIITDLMGGDAGYNVVTDELFDEIANFRPVDENGDFDTSAFMVHANECLYDENAEDENPPGVLHEFFTQTYAIENVAEMLKGVTRILTLGAM